MSEKTILEIVQDIQESATSLGADISLKNTAFVISSFIEVVLLEDIARVREPTGDKHLDKMVSDINEIIHRMLQKLADELNSVE